MNNTTRFIIWLILVILLGLLWFGPWYPCWQEVFCADCITGAEESALIGEAGEDESEQIASYDGPLAFSWDSAEPIRQDGFEAFRQEILADMSEDNILEITGLYYDAEGDPEEEVNMGFARARSVAELFPEIPEDRLSFKARAEEEPTDENVREGRFAGAAFNWLQPEATEKESVEELDDRVIIRFPLASTQRISDPAIDEYLDKVAARVIETGERIQLTGHADNTGTEETNMQLGMDRANAIKAVLLEKGVPEGQITVNSRGEEQPVATNETEAGRAENRRVELRRLESN